MSFIEKLIFGKQLIDEEINSESAIQRKWRNLKSIWNNEHRNDMGIEKLVRLILAGSQLFFMGTYIKQIFGIKGEAHRNLAIEFFVIFKTIFPILILYNRWQENTFLIFLIIWFLTETMLYVPTLIFASDIYTKPRSYGRSMFLVFLNYIEVTFAFGVLYANINGMNKPFITWFDPLYFSLITSASIGYGDYYPVAMMAKMVVGVQSLIFLLFVVLFLNFFSGKLESKGYFGK